MASLGKKLLSAFIEINETDSHPAAVTREQTPTHIPALADAAPVDTHNKFSQHFDKLFADADLPGPGYYEFAKMTAAMQVIPDEKARFSAAFAGLQVQGLTKGQLLSSALDYLHLLETDAATFEQTLAVAQSEKVQNRKEEISKGQTRIQQLSQEIMDLQQHLAELSKEVTENEAKIENSKAGYATALAHNRQQLQQDIERIKQHIL